MVSMTKNITERIAMVLVCVMILSVALSVYSIQADAAVSATDINAYVSAYGDLCSTLSEERKKGYEIARQAAINNSNSASISTVGQQYGYYLYLYEHPAIANNIRIITKSEAAATLNKAVEIANRATGTTKYEQALALHDMLSDTVDFFGYEGGNWKGQSAYEALVLRTTSCNGFASAYKLLCDLKGIPCHIAYGEMIEDGSSDTHAWNVVQLDDGQWYEVDVTSDTMTSSHAYFCQTTESFANFTSPGGSKIQIVRKENTGDPRTTIAPIANGSKYRYVAVTGISIEGPDQVDAGKSMTLKATLSPANATDKKVKWVSYEPSIASVDSNGNVTGHKPGGTTIFAEPADNATAFASKYIVVRDAPILVSEISFSGTITAGSTILLTADVSPQNAAKKNVKWSSSNPSVAIVDDSGYITGVKPGTATIKAEAVDGSGIYKSFSIKVNKADTRVAGIKISGEKTLRAGSKISLSAEVYPDNAKNKKLKWTSSNKSIATVNSSGIVSAKKAGKVTIKASATDGSALSAGYQITVIKKNADPAKSKIVKKVNGVNYKELGGMKINISWKVQRSAIRYEIQVATDKKFKKNLVKKLFYKDDDNLTIKYKKTGPAYFRVRAYDKYGYISEWSDAQSVYIR